jgi:hypothetical protein
MSPKVLDKIRAALLAKPPQPRTHRQAPAR